ncbi:MAG: ThuA domain-containing protein [bacterium]
MSTNKALVVWCGWDGHTPEQSVRVFIPWLEKQGFSVEVASTLDAYADGEKLKAQSLILQCCTMSKITGEQSGNLQAAVAAGVGLAGWHGGIIDSFREDTGYQFMTGGQWVAHPGNCIPSYQVKITDRQHEITRGLADFELKETEQYYIHVDPGVQVLCTTTFTGQHGDLSQYAAGTVMPYAYTRQWGKGRVFVACWGHTFKDFDVPEAREIVQRGLLWAASR